ncbi:MAG: hypothetical protein E6L03_09320 [Thaumarchaeota archaeon]|nr:MAG: hypothetical protein E6L03_09320 [Nitrososphaerota archaeon]
MTSKKVVYLSSAIFGAIGILVSVAIIALNGGFSGNGPSILNPPTSKDQWSIGSNIVDGMNLTYSLTSIGEESSLRGSIVSIKFNELKDKWNINFKINNGSTVKESSANFSKKQLLITDPITKENEKFIQPVESSILAIRDIAREPKYLVVGAVWDKIFTGSSTIDVKIVNTDTISISKDSYKVYVLQSKVGNSTSKIYLNKDLPLPIKADVYDENDKVVYQYELQSVLK